MIPPTVYPPETTLADLRTAELLLVMTLRLFVLPGRVPETRHPDWRNGLRAAFVASEAEAAFDGLFRIVAAARHRPIDVRPPPCAALGLEEGRLLQIVSLFQHGRPDAAIATLGDWLPPAAQRLATAPAEVLSATLFQAGLVVPWRRTDVGQAVAGHELRANPGLVLVQ